MTTTTIISPAETSVPAWIHGMTFCHIGPEGDERCLCGHVSSDEFCPSYYNGEAICPSCGNPTCPRCAQLDDLESRAEAP